MINIQPVWGLLTRIVPVYHSQSEYRQEIANVLSLSPRCNRVTPSWLCVASLTAVWCLSFTMTSEVYLYPIKTSRKWDAAAARLHLSDRRKSVVEIPSLDRTGPVQTKTNIPYHVLTCDVCSCSLIYKFSRNVKTLAAYWLLQWISVRQLRSPSDGETLPPSLPPSRTLTESPLHWMDMYTLLEFEVFM